MFRGSYPEMMAISCCLIFIMSESSSHQYLLKSEEPVSKALEGPAILSPFSQSASLLHY